MAGTGLLMLLDDITTILDDVAAMSKLAGKKTVGVLGDDVALNAEQVSGVAAQRELPVVWAVAKGSLLNKLILVPVALLISAFLPWVITPLLMLGGLFLCFEGAEKIIHSFRHRKHHAPAPEAASTPNPRLTQKLDKASILAQERTKIKGAIRTDFILSAEIVAITLGIVATHPFTTRALVVSLVALVLTVVVYGIVAAVVKLDDVGGYLLKRKGQGWSKRLSQATGRGVLAFAPYLMRGLSIAGTIAMFLVGGGLLVHGITPLQGWVDHAFHETSAGHATLIEAAGTYFGPTLVSGITGIIAGFLVYGVVALVQRMRGK